MGYRAAMASEHDLYITTRESAWGVSRLGRRPLTMADSRSVSERLARWMGQRSQSGRKPLRMLQHTFCHLPGISVTTERQLWAAGIDSWDAALAVDRGRLPRRHQRALADHLPASLEHLARGNPAPFADGLPAHQHWRLLLQLRLFF